MDIMKLQTVFLLICALKTSSALPVRIGLIASNSNEILGFNQLALATLGQNQNLFPYILQQQPEILFNPPMVNLIPDMTGPFGPQLVPINQGNQVPSVVIPNGQQEQTGTQQNPNNPTVLQDPQNPMQMNPNLMYQFLGYPQLHRQGNPYYRPPYRFPQQRNPAVIQPNNGQQNLERTTQRPQLPLQQGSKLKPQTEKTWIAGTKKESTTTPPDPRGDTTGPGNDEGNPNFPFLFEP